MENTVFNTLNSVNCNEHTEKKNGLTYLSWAWAWSEVKKHYPGANYTIYENKDGWNYFTDGRTCWVKTGVTIEGLEHIEYLPVMDYRNNSIPVEKVTSFDVNKAIQRSLTKAAARHGLGLYIYAGEDLPDTMDNREEGTNPKASTNPLKPASKTTERPLIQEGNELWTKAIAYCRKNKCSALALRKYYNISDADIKTMDSILSFSDNLNN